MKNELYERLLIEKLRNSIDEERRKEDLLILQAEVNRIREDMEKSERYDTTSTMPSYDFIRMLMNSIREEKEKKGHLPDSLFEV
jgi:hypothetical protein